MTLPAHSHVGASSAKRWMVCPGSVALSKSIAGLDEDEEQEWTKEGSAAHELAALCLKNDQDPWEFAGQELLGVAVDDGMVEAVTLYVHEARKLLSRGTQHYIEHRLAGPHEGMFGTIDCGTISDSLATVTDLKYGKGIYVEVEENPQIMYYAYLLLLRHPGVRRVVLRIVQPRMPDAQGNVVRRWETTAEHICTWAEEQLIPAMKRTARDNSLDCGEHCRFCPAKLICPLLTGIFEAAAIHNPAELVYMTDAALAQSYRYSKAVRFYCTAVDREVERRLHLGRTLDTAKLVHGKTDRIWKDGAEEVFVKEFAGDAWAPLELKSPAQMEKLPGAKPLVKKYAYLPEGRLTVAPMEDRRMAARVKSSAEVFAGADLDDW